MKSRVLIAQVRQRNAGRAKKPGSEVHSGARARGQEGDQDKDDVYEDGQSHAEHYPEKAPARRAAPTSPTEHDDEEVHDPQTRRHLDVLSYPDLRCAERLALPATKRGMQSQNEQPDHGSATRQPQGMTMQPPRALPRLQRNIDSPPRIAVGVVERGRAHGYRDVHFYTTW